MRKTVKIGKTVYSVKVEEDEIDACATTYPRSGYGNCYEDGWTIELNYSRGWARLTVNGADHGWARRGSMENSWIDAVGYIRKAEAKEFKAVILKELEQAEDGTPDVKEVFNKIRDFVENNVAEEDE